MAYLEYMLKCAGVPSGDALTELLGTFQNKPASTLEKTASYSEGIRSLGKMLHGVSGGDMYKLGKCAALCKFAVNFKTNPKMPKAVQDYQNKYFQLNKPKFDARDAMNTAKGAFDASKDVLNTAHGKTQGLTNNVNAAQQKVDALVNNPVYSSPNATPQMQKELADARADLANHQTALTNHQNYIGTLQQNSNNLEQEYLARQAAYKAVPGLTPAQLTEIQQARNKMHKEMPHYHAEQQRIKNKKQQEAIDQQKAEKAKRVAAYNIDRTTGEYGAELRAAVDAASPEARKLFELGMRRQGSLTEDVAGIWQGFRQGINYEYNGVPLRSNYKTDLDFLQACNDFYARKASIKAEAESEAATKRAIKQEEQNRQDAHEEKQQQFAASEAEKQRQHEETMGKQTADLVKSQSESGDRASESKFKSMAIGGGILGVGGLGTAIALRPTTPVMPMYGYAPQPQPMMPPQQQQQ